MEGHPDGPDPRRGGRARPGMPRRHHERSERGHPGPVTVHAELVSQPRRAAPHHIRARCLPGAASPGRPGHEGHAHRADARSGQRPRAVCAAPHVPGGDRDRGPDHRRHAHALARGRVELRPGGHRGRSAPPAVRPVLGGGRRGDSLHGAVRGRLRRDSCLAGRHPAFTRAPAPRPVAGPDRRRDAPPPASPPTPPRPAARPRRRRPSPRRSRPPTACSRWKPNASWPPATPEDQPRAPTRARSSPCSPRSARSPPGTRCPVSSPRCASASARPGTASPSRWLRTSRPSGPASSRAGTRRRRPLPPSCSLRWPLSCRTSTGRGSAWPG